MQDWLSWRGLQWFLAAAKVGTVVTIVILMDEWRETAAATLEVGPGKRFARIEDANAQAQAGDLILVYPRENDQPYERTAVFVRQSKLTFRGVPKAGTQGVKVSGKGFNYSGAGSVPRAIFQFNRGADDCLLEGFELFGAHNESHNGAGVRINQANRITIRHCAIHGNDMGIMSNGDGTPQTALAQRIEHCRIYQNGDPTHPGYNHNLYLGGTSVVLSFCEVFGSLTGHNVKSRAHHTRLQYCYVHHSANRECDLVDAADTARPNSHAVLLGNVIVKDPRCRGNRAVIHFGQDGGKEHDGTLYLAFNTVVTPFVSPVVELSAPQAAAHLVGNIICDGGRRPGQQTLVAVRGGASIQRVMGMHNWFSGEFGNTGGLDAKTNLFRRAPGGLFVDPTKHNYRLQPALLPQAKSPLVAEKLSLPPPPGVPEAELAPPLSWEYHHPAEKAKRPHEDGCTMGAFARQASQ